MSYGGYHPYPARRFGGAKPHLQVIHESLNAQRGTAYDASNPETIVWLENMAIARGIYFDGWCVNERLSYQWDPDRVTDMMPRWEKIFGIVSPYNATKQSRRVVLRRRWRRFINRSALHSRLVALCSEVLGPVFVAIEYISLANAVVHVPDNSYPPAWNATVVAGIPWYSTVAHILILTERPSGWTEGDFMEAIGRLMPEFDAVAPAWCSFDWYRGSDCGPHINVIGGPSRAGFYLDCPRNLDFQVFDT